MLENEISDYIRVTNVKGDPEYRSTADEKIVIVHRGNKTLGNRHVMKQASMNERERVIKAYKEDLELDLKINGPMSKMIYEIADDLVKNHQKIALECFCAPCNCHGFVVLNEVVRVAKKILENENEIRRIKVKNI
jgi:hypothetical protein